MKRIYSVTKAYHSTKQKGLKKFESRTTTATIDTGEGAHVHGWGLYLQADEMQNREMYLKGFAGVSTRGSDYKVTIFGKTVNAYYTDDMCSINDYDSFTVYDFDDDLEEAVYLLITLLLNGYEPNYINDVLMECIDNGVSDEDDFENETPEILLHWSDDAIIDAANLALEVNEWDAEEIPEELETLPDGTHYEKASQYTVEIPDDMVFIDEDKPVDISIIKKFVDYMIDKGIFKTPSDMNAGLYRFQKTNGETGRQFYDSLRGWFHSEEKVSLWLAEHGVDGMTYEGGRDNGCFVIYNCDKLKIIAEY